MFALWNYKCFYLFGSLSEWCRTIRQLGEESILLVRCRDDSWYRGLGVVHVEDVEEKAVFVGLFTEYTVLLPLPIALSTSSASMPGERLGLNDVIASWGDNDVIGTTDEGLLVEFRGDWLSPLSSLPLIRWVSKSRSCNRKFVWGSMFGFFSRNDAIACSISIDSVVMRKPISTVDDRLIPAWQWTKTPVFLSMAPSERREKNVC